MKNDLPYFSHYSTAHDEPRMQALLAEHGFEGYGRFWILCEKIAASPNAVLDISSRVIKLTIARTLGLDPEDFDDFMGFLNAPDVKLIKLENGLITTDQLQEDYRRVAKKRKTDRVNYHSNDNPSTETAIPASEMPVPTSEKIQNRVENNILDQSTEDQNIKNNTVGLSDHFLLIWKNNPDVFNPHARIKKFKEWQAFWEQNSITMEQIDSAMVNFIDGVNTGAIECKYIPSSPDNFVLNNHLARSQKPYKKPKHHRIANDEMDKKDISKYFREIDDETATTQTENIDF
jgi:hypothetical protein